jgi:hypothetical protein
LHCRFVSAAINDLHSFGLREDEVMLYWILPGETDMSAAGEQAVKG